MTPEQLKASILQYAIQGKLVEQRLGERTATELYHQIQNEKQRLIKEGKIKKEKPLAEITEDEIPFDIPETWKWVRLADICSQVSDGTHKTPSYTAEGIPFVSVKDISSGYLDFSNTKFISLEEHNQLIARCKPEDGDILICRIGTLGKAIKIETQNEFSIFVSLGLIKPVDKLLSDYIVMTINSGYGFSWIQKVKVGGGTHTFKINLDDLRSFPIPLPPIEEQHRIVAKIEELLPYVDRYAEAYEKLEQFNAKFPEDMKKSILQYAIQGKLVEHRPEEGTAEELYQQIQEDKKMRLGGKKEGKLSPEEFKEDEIPYDIPESWKWVRFGHIMINRDAERIPLSVSEREKLEKKYDYYGASGVIDKVDRFLFNEKLLLIGEDGANLLSRSTPIAFLAEGEYWVNNHAHVLDCNKELVCIEYIMYYINAITLAPYVTGTAQPKMNQEKMNSIPIALPPIKEQCRIVDKIEELLPYCDCLAK